METSAEKIHADIEFKGFNVTSVSKWREKVELNHAIISRDFNSSQTNTENKDKQKLLEHKR